LVRLRLARLVKIRHSIPTSVKYMPVCVGSRAMSTIAAPPINTATTSKTRQIVRLVPGELFDVVVVLPRSALASVSVAHDDP
jgi:hypothetical protein